MGGARWHWDILGHVSIEFASEFGTIGGTQGTRVSKLQILPASGSAVTLPGTESMQMLDHGEDLVESVDHLTQNADVASDPGGVSVPEEREFGTSSDQSCGSRGVHEYRKLGFFFFRVWREMKWFACPLLHPGITCISITSLQRGGDFRSPGGDALTRGRASLCSP